MSSAIKCDSAHSLGDAMVHSPSTNLGSGDGLGPQALHGTTWSAHTHIIVSFGFEKTADWRESGMTHGRHIRPPTTEGAMHRKCDTLQRFRPQTLNLLPLKDDEGMVRPSDAASSRKRRKRLCTQLLLEVGWRCPAALALWGRTTEGWGLAGANLVGLEQVGRKGAR